MCSAFASLVIAGVLERHQFAPARQVDRIVEGSLDQRKVGRWRFSWGPDFIDLKNFDLS